MSDDPEAVVIDEETDEGTRRRVRYVPTADPPRREEYEPRGDGWRITGVEYLESVVIT